MQNALIGKRILVAQATDLMGPAICDVLAEQGAEVIADTLDLAPAANEAAAVGNAGDVGPGVSRLRRLGQVKAR